MERLQAIAAIPDLLETADRKVLGLQVAKLKQQMDRDLIDLSKRGVAQRAEQWQNLTMEFAETEQRLSFESIAQAYQLSPEAVSVLKQLVEGERVSLAQLSPKALEELGQFQRFCEAITLRFRS